MGVITVAGKSIAYGAVSVKPVPGRVEVTVEDHFYISLSPEDALLFAQELAGAFKSAKIQSFQDRVVKIMRGDG